MTDIEVPPPTMPQFQAAVGLQANAAALVHALCGAQYGDLEFDVGKSIRWTQWFVDDVHITDVNLGTPRYWIVNWTETYPQAFHTVTGVNFFYNTVAFRKEQWKLARSEQGLQFDPEDWVLFVDAHEGLAVDTRDPQPPNFDVEPFKAYLYREIQRAETAGKDRVVLPFYAFVKHDNVQTVYYDSPAFADGSLGFTTATATMGTPYYVPYQGMTRLIKVRVLDDPTFDWASIDTPSAPASGLNISIVSYGYAHWNLQDIVPPATTVEPLSATNDDGWRMRKLLSLVRPIPGLPYADPWQPPNADTNGIPGPWAATDQFTPDPVIDSGPYLNMAVGTVSTPDTAMMAIPAGQLFRVTMKAWMKTLPVSGFPMLLSKVGAGFANRELMIYVTGPTGYTAWSSANVVPAQVDGIIVNPILTDRDHVIGFEATQGVTPYTSIVDSIRTGRTATTAPVFPDTTMALKLGDTALSARLYWAQLEYVDRRRFVFPGIINNYMAIPDAANLRITGSFEVVARAQIDWRADNTFAARYATTGVGGRSFFFYMDATLPGRPRLAISQDGSAGNTGTSTVAVPFTTEMGWLKATYDAPTGTMRFYTAPDAGATTEPTTWTQLGGDRTGLPTSVFAGTARLLIGRHDVSDSNPLNGRLSRFILRNGIGGTKAFDVGEASASAVAPGATAFTSNDTANRYAYFGTGVASNPNSIMATVPQPAGDLEWVFRVSQNDWDVAVPNAVTLSLVPIWITGSSASIQIARAYWGARSMIFQWWGVGAGTAVGGSGDLQWSYPAGLAPKGGFLWIRFRLDVDNGAGGHTLTAEYAPDGPTEPTTWTAWGAPVTKPGTITSFLATTGFRFGGGTNQLPIDGAIRRFIYRTGFGGTTRIDFDADVNLNGVVPTATSFPLTTGGTATVSRSGTPQTDLVTGRQPVTVNQTPPNQIIQAMNDMLIWRFDAAERTGEGTSYTDPRGRVWTATAAGAFVANTADPTPQPVPPDPSLAGLLVPLYDNVLRINMRDGVYYEGGELGNIPLAWDDATKTWYPRDMSPQQWHDTEEWVAPVS